MDVKVGPWRRLSAKELVPLNCGAEKTLESPLTARRSKSVNPRGNQPWIFTGRTDAEAEAPILWPPDAKSWLFGKNPNAGKEKAGGKGDDRGWNGWMASLIRWTWVWASSESWWRTGRPGMLQSMGLQSWTWLRDWTISKTLNRTLVSVREANININNSWPCYITSETLLSTFYGRAISDCFKRPAKRINYSHLKRLFPKMLDVSVNHTVISDSLLPLGH